MDMFKRLPAGSGRAVNKKQLQDFIKEILFEKDLAEVSDFEQGDCSDYPAATATIIHTVSEAVKTGDFSRLSPMLDFVFQKELKARK